MRRILFIILLLGTFQTFAQNRLLFKEHDKFGYTDSSGTIVIPAIFDEAADFHDGFAIVEDSIHPYIIDSLGKRIFTLSTYFDYNGNYTPYPFSFSEGLLVAYDPDCERYGFIDTSMTWVIPPIFFEAHSFSEGLAAVWENPNWHPDIGSGCGTSVTHSEWGYIDKNGIYVIPPIGASIASQFIDDIAFCGGDIIDTLGQIVVPHKQLTIKHQQKPNYMIITSPSFILIVNPNNGMIVEKRMTK